MDSPPRPVDRRSSLLPAASTEGPCRLLVTLASLGHYKLSIDRSCRLFVAQRTIRPFAELEEIATCFGAIDEVLREVPRRMYALLVDARLGPLRNDPKFEEALSNHRGRLLFGFNKNAALLATAAGVLQVKRFARSDGRKVFATHEPNAAFEYLGVMRHPL